MCSSFRRHYTPKRRKCPPTVSMHFTTSRTERTSWLMRGGWPRPMAGQPAQTFEEIEEYGVERWLRELAEDLRKEDVSATSDAACLHLQARRVETAIGNIHDPGPGGPDGGSPRTVRPVRTGRGATRSLPAPVHLPHRIVAVGGRQRDSLHDPSTNRCRVGQRQTTQCSQTKGP